MNAELLYVLTEAAKHKCAEELYFETNNINYIYEIINNDNEISLENLINNDPECKKKIKRLFFHSIFTNSIKCGILLIKHIKDLNETFFMDNCYIQASTEYNCLEITEELLKMGANPNLITTNNCCPIVNAVKNNNTEMVKLLRKYNAIINVLIHFYNDLLKYKEKSLIKNVIDTMSLEDLYISSKYNLDEEIRNYTIDKIYTSWHPVINQFDKRNMKMDGILGIIKDFVI